MSSSPVVPERNGDAASWRTLKTIATAGVMAAAIFGAGMSWGAVREQSTKIDSQGTELKNQQKYIDDTFIRKDGRELEGVRNELSKLSERVSELSGEVRALRGVR